MENWTKTWMSNPKVGANIDLGDQSSDLGDKSFLLILSQQEKEQFEKGKLVFDKTTCQLVPSYKVFSDTWIKRAKQEYEDSRGKYWKEWGQLSDDEREELIEKYKRDNAHTHLDHETFVQLFQTAIITFGTARPPWRQEKSRELEDGQKVWVYAYHP